MKKIGFIGCGARSLRYLRNLLQSHPGEWSVPALCDINEENVKRFGRILGNTDFKYYTDSQKMLDEEELDGVVLAIPNKFHREPAIKAMSKGIPLLLEKPVAIDLEDCKALWNAYCENGRPPVVVGFVLRYTPFYSKINEIIESGRLGKILTINAEEFLSEDLSLVFRRGWRKDKTYSGPFIAEKCCHDLDILNWFSQSSAHRISSFEGRTYFVEEDDMGDRCEECSQSDRCAYAMKYPGEPCLFKETEHPDHQVAIIEYENGILANFTVTAMQSASRRTIRINGTDASLYGDINDDFMIITPRSSADKGVREVCEIIKIKRDSSGHHGGDSVISNAFWQAVNGDGNVVKAGLEEGIQGALLAIAADESVQMGRIVDAKALLEEVFHENTVNPAR